MKLKRRDWVSRGGIVAALVLTLALPFVLREEAPVLLDADATLVVITPHNGAIRQEFAWGFQAWYQARTGRTVNVDWRVIGGTADITRFLEGEYLTAFRLYWERDLQRPWTNAVMRSFDNHRVEVDDSPENDTKREAARRAFLESEVSSGIDLFFGGGSYDFIRQARAGRLVRSGILAERPEWFTDDVIPPAYNGEPFTDPQGRWQGAVLASFGIIHNTDAYVRLGIENPPTRWSDLADPRLRGELALADPTKSGSINKAFEMVVQQAMQDRLRELSAMGVVDAEAKAVREGWDRGLRLLQILGANARYFTDSSQKVPIDVFQGDSAAGMCIDFYGRYQAEAVIRRDGKPRVEYVTPPGGSVFSVDPIAMLRGAPNREVGLAFIEFVLSPVGQKLWDYRVGTEGGPKLFALRRMPIRKDAYGEASRRQMADPNVAPYGPQNNFIYHASWTGGLFRELAFVMRVMCLDPHGELTRAWRVILENGKPDDALKALTDLSAVDYATASGEIKAALRAPDPIEAIRLAKRLSNHFRTQYRNAEALARKAGAHRD